MCLLRYDARAFVDIVDGNENRILGLLSSLYQFFKRAQGTKSPRARTLNMAQSSKIVKPNTQRSLTLMSKSQSAVSSKTSNNNYNFLKILIMLLVIIIVIIVVGGGVYVFIQPLMLVFFCRSICGERYQRQ